MKKMMLCVASVLALLGMSRQLMATDNTATSYSTETITNQKVVYEPRVLAQLKWGDGPGEIGYRITPAIGEKTDTKRVAAPLQLSVDIHNILYILDGKHRRILKYDSTTGLPIGTIENLAISGNGDNFTAYAMHVDSCGVIYVGYDDFPSHYFIFTKTGKLLARILYKEEIEKAIAHAKQRLDALNTNTKPLDQKDYTQSGSTERRLQEEKMQNQLTSLNALFADPLNKFVSEHSFLQYDEYGSVYMGNYEISGAEIREETADILQIRKLRSSEQEYIQLRNKIIISDNMTSSNIRSNELKTFWDNECIDDHKYIYKLVFSDDPKYLNNLAIVKWMPK